MTTLFGLVLSGGKSTRMGRDKGSLIYERGLSQRERGLELLSPFCDQVFVSCRREQDPLLPQQMPRIHDKIADVGPAAGLLAAWEAHPVPWLIFACDFPFCRDETIARLVSARSPEHAATAYTSGGLIEPFFAIWEPEALRALADECRSGRLSPSRTLSRLNVKFLRPADDAALRNVNS